MRDIIIAGNWKMNKDLNEVKAFCKAVARAFEGRVMGKVVPILAPSHPFLTFMLRELGGGPIKIAAQDASSHTEGAFTGDVSAKMLSSLGVQYCIVGHSERRAYHNESNEIIRDKVLEVMDNGMKPILCIGETLEQRDSGITDQVILEQLEGCLRGITLYTGKELMVAYEPVWAIGTGRNASGDQAQEVHRLIRKWLKDSFSQDLADQISILYGGSVKPQNLAELLAQPDIDGGLIGGASLDAESFLKMVDIAINY
ncbi:MAG TPA: triose-phosphate isomerase [Candidatus Cloacimonadota bacterium]|nr:triose-phosphate isomerase [Candidatus Cloacimonadota bacterium]